MWRKPSGASRGQLSWGPSRLGSEICARKPKWGFARNALPRERHHECEAQAVNTRRRNLVHQRSCKPAHGLGAPGGTDTMTGHAAETDLLRALLAAGNTATPLARENSTPYERRVVQLFRTHAHSRSVDPSPKINDRARKTWPTSNRARDGAHPLVMRGAPIPARPGAERRCIRACTSNIARHSEDAHGNRTDTCLQEWASSHSPEFGAARHSSMLRETPPRQAPLRWRQRSLSNGGRCPTQSAQTVHHQPCREKGFRGIVAHNAQSNERQATPRLDLHNQRGTRQCPIPG